jgi:hypothetical protein
LFPEGCSPRKRDRGLQHRANRSPRKSHEHRHRYNGALETLKAIYADIATEARDYYEERSEKWQEGEAGEQYSAWLDTLENADLEDIDLELADDLDEPDHPDFDDPEGLPAESPDDM